MAGYAYVTRKGSHPATVQIPCVLSMTPPVDRKTFRSGCRGDSGVCVVVQCLDVDQTVNRTCTCFDEALAQHIPRLNVRETFKEAT